MKRVAVIGASVISPSFFNTFAEAGANDNGFVSIGPLTFGSPFLYSAGPDGSVSSYIVPSTGVYDIVAGGADGAGSRLGSFGGAGALVGGDIWLKAETVLYIVVGQQGLPGITYGDVSGGGGGGGSFVFVYPVPELSVWAMMLIGFAGLGFYARTRMRAR